MCQCFDQCQLKWSIAAYKANHHCSRFCQLFLHFKYRLWQLKQAYSL